MVPRRDVFDPYKVGTYHCFSQCVRQLFLLGFDRLTQQHNEHRRDMAVSELERLAGTMGIDVLEFTLMENHVHVILRNRPDIVAGWSDLEVAKRWWSNCPKRRDKDGKPKEPTDKDLAPWLNDPATIAEFRRRLSHISWLMWFWLGKIARVSNKEDGKHGHFFADRFGCQRLEDEGALLACSVYTALNPVRAGMTEEVVGYLHSSITARVAGENLRQLRAEGVAVEGDDPDAWLAPLFLDERSLAYDGSLQEVDGEMRHVPASKPFPSARLSDKGYTPVKLPMYLSILQWTAANVRSGDLDAAVPHDLEGVLRGVGVDPELWIDTVARYETMFHYIVGTYEQMTAAAARLKRRWLQGSRECGRRFGQERPSAAGSLSTGESAVAGPSPGSVGD